MEMQQAGLPLEIADEIRKGCVRIRLYRQAGPEPLYALELVAWSDWAGQGKLLLYTGNWHEHFARSRFDELSEGVRDYSWAVDDLVMHDAK